MKINNKELGIYLIENTNKSLSKYTIITVLEELQSLKKGEKISKEKLMTHKGIGEYKAENILNALRRCPYFPSNKISDTVLCGDCKYSYDDFEGKNCCKKSSENVNAFGGVTTCDSFK